MSDTGLRVLLVDDQPLIRAGITVLLTGAESMIEVVGEASDGAAALVLVRSLLPDVVLMDIRMPGMGGIEATRAIRADATLSRVAVVMLTTFDNDEEVLGALRAGASGYLLKDATPVELRDAVRAAAQGDPSLSPAIARRVITQATTAPLHEPDPRLQTLTEREREVLTQVARGHNNQVIAARLHLSPETVRTYVSRILGKLGAESRAQLVAIAHRSGLAADG